MPLLVLCSVWSWCALLNPTGVHSWWNTVGNATRTWSILWAPTPLASNFPPKISSYQPNINNPPQFPVSVKLLRPLRVRPALTSNSFPIQPPLFSIAFSFSHIPPSDTFRGVFQVETSYDFFVFWIIIGSQSESESFAHILIHRSQRNLFLRGNIMMQLQLLRQYLTDRASCSGCFLIIFFIPKWLLMLKRK